MDSPAKTKKKSNNCLKTDNQKISVNYEFVYYNDFWSNTKEYNKIENGLYLGTDKTIKDQSLMDMLEINHVISVMEDPVPQCYRWTNVNYIHIEAGDFPDQDLVSNFDNSFKIILNAQQNDEAVFVNCGGGVSRSATIVIAFIMKKYRISFTDALKRVSKKRKVFPNEGFVVQLSLYERMQWFVNGFHEEYRRFLFKTLTYELRSDGLTSENSLKSEIEQQMSLSYEANCVRNYFEKIAKAEQFAQSYGYPSDKGMSFYCCNCHTELFNEINIIDNKDPSSLCPRIFIEPLPTFSTQSEGEKNGSLKCPNCLNIFGSYNWFLYQCNCSSHQNYTECLALRVFPLKILV